jgi:hypothetical protein
VRSVKPRASKVEDQSWVRRFAEADHATKSIVMDSYLYGVANRTRADSKTEAQSGDSQTQITTAVNWCLCGVAGRTQVESKVEVGLGTRRSRLH